MIRYHLFAKQTSQSSDFYSSPDYIFHTIQRIGFCRCFRGIEKQHVVDAAVMFSFPSAEQSDRLKESLSTEP